MASIPSPASDGLDLGPFFFHFYGLAYVVAIAAAVAITRRRWRAQEGDPDVVVDVAIWAVPAGILGGRLYHDLTSWNEVPHTWWGWAAIWQGGLGIWGGIAAGTVVGLWVLRRRKVEIPRFMDAAAPALLVAQAIGRIGNYFNQELFGSPTHLPWALQIDPAHRPSNYLASPTFHPVFLYELLFDLALAATLVWLGHHRRIRAPGLFALYVAGYSAFRIFEELLRVDPAHHLLGLRLNFFVAGALVLAATVWFVRVQGGHGALGLKRSSSLVAVGAAVVLCGCGGADRASAAAQLPLADGCTWTRLSPPRKDVPITASGFPRSRIARIPAGRTVPDESAASRRVARGGALGPGEVATSRWTWPSAGWFPHASLGS